MLVSIIIIKLIINLIRDITCSTKDCVSRPKIYSARSLVNLKKNVYKFT